MRDAATVADGTPQTHGILLKLAALAVFSVMGACIKAAREVVPPGEAVFFRAALAIPPILLYALIRGQLEIAVRPVMLDRHLWRGVIGLTGMGLSFYALGLLPLPEVTAISFAAPLIVTVLAVLMLGEVVRVYRWSAVVVGFAGVVVMVWPRLTIADGDITPDETVGVLAMLVCAVLFAVAQIEVRRMTRSVPVIAIVFWFHMICTVGSLLTMPWGWVLPPPELWLLLVISGVFGGVGQILVTESYSRADASTLAPFDYMMMLYSVLIGYFVFGEVPVWSVVVGAPIVIGAGLFILWRERRRGVRRPGARAAMPPHAK